MKQADVVIGANYGDEGKGLFTDYLAMPYGQDALVVRFNGGAQAGHTVTLPDGRRHIFSHFGSGTLAGAATYLSRYFVCNPLLYGREHRLLQAIDITPQIYIDPTALVTTPYDMMINQIVEEARGDRRHGSCGVGFGETIERSEKSPHLLRAEDLKDEGKLTQMLCQIRRDWLPERLVRLGVPCISPEWQARIDNDAIIDGYIEAAWHMLTTCDVALPAIIGSARHVLFEGAQGLLLDQDRGAFPHVTRSNTGLKNCAALAQQAGLTHLNVTYATRAYLTRHGAGPLPRELPCQPYADIVDLTNKPNPYQGNLRFAWLDLDQLGRAIADDLQDNAGLQIRPRLGISCLDQVGDSVTYIADGRLHSSDHESFVETALNCTGLDHSLTSFGPTRQTIRVHMLQPLRCTA